MPRAARWPWWIRWPLGIVVTLVLAVGIALWAIDTGPGHRFIADRIGALPIRSGLRIRIGRIDGSIWRRARLVDLRLYDLDGLFFEAPEVRLDWRPTRWLANRLDVRDLTSDFATLHRIPRLRPTGRDQPILPDFDIALGRLKVTRLVLGPQLAGRRRVAGLDAQADIRSGRALLDLRARVAGGGDRLLVRLDAEPRANRFDLAGELDAPADSVAGVMLGTRGSIQARIGGRGTYQRWDGTAQAEFGGRRVVDLTLGARDGRYTLTGGLTPSPFLNGKAQRLTAPRIGVTGEARFADRRLDGQVELRSAALAINAKGVVDLAESRFDPLKIDANLLRPAALFPNMSGRNIRLQAELTGAFSTASFRYRLTSPRFAFDQTGFEGASAFGAGRFSRAPIAVPIRFHARRVTGVGDVAGGILGNLDLAGTLKVTPKLLTGDGLTLRSDKLNGRLALLVDLVTGNYAVTLSGGLRRYLIPGLGIVDVSSELRVVPGPGGRGTRVIGRGRAAVRRFDNAFLRGLAGGLPQIDTALERQADGTIRFTGLRLTAPALRITGNGFRRRDGTFFFEGGGNQATYGPLRLRLDGRIDKPKLDIVLARPADALGLSDVVLALDPNAEGFAWQARGGSTLGPFTGAGQIALPAGQPATVRVARLDVSGTTASGALRSDPGGFTGRLDLAGGGLSGPLLFAPQGEIQRIEAHLLAAGAMLGGVADMRVRRGRLDAVLLLDPAGTAIEATTTAYGLRRGSISLARLAGNASLKGGRGTVKASVAGSRGRAFALSTVLGLEPGRITLIGQGEVDRKPLRLAAPAVLSREGDGWRLARTQVDYAGGSAAVAGRFGPGATELEADLTALPLVALDIFYPGLGLGGKATGSLIYRTAAGAAPTGRANLTVRGLTRSGLVLSSQAIDVGVAAVLRADGAVGRATMASGGRTIGRAQARVAPLAPGQDLVERLRRAPLFAQLRYTGPADTLWRLTGIETIDLSGPVAIGADIGGTLADPLIRGSLKAQGARLESAVSGTVIEQLVADGRFGGSRLVIDRFTGGTPRGGTIAGRAAFDLAGGLGIDIAANANKALLLNRDDIRAQVTGPLAIRSDGRGGVISGDLELDAGRFRLGQAAAATVPRLPVQEVNRAADDPEPVAAAAPWRLDLRARADNRLTVNGLGLDSEWRADLTIKGNVDNPAITGRADLVRGNYEFAGRRFDLDRGMIRFQGEAPPDPLLDIVANANIQGLSATIRVSGTGQKPQIDFQSVPALPEDELLSRLLFGSSITSLSAPEALQLAAAVASLRQGGGGIGLNPINTLRRAAGLDRLRILPADPTTGAGTAIAAGKYLGRRTFVEVISDGQGYSATRLEFQVTRWLSLLSTISTIGRQSANVRVSKDY
ncbi:autotransporter secretion inner membrane protein TamB [Sphingomonas jatrophae]|uniref:Autotransporter secretion inner membrane protein TamB n=1 Tax=Sphingomonas jatrophae TaxID=1166337 RepID=A0A1I6K7A8_9SPHN|nr:autotransporter secretion inner membrane protein TamB [Sphingomonas jatrophae]